MASIPPSTQFRIDSYEVVDGGTTVTFLLPNPGPGNPSYQTLLLTDTDLATVVTPLDLTNLVQSRLNRKFRAQGIASKLDPAVASQQSWTV